MNSEESRTNGRKINHNSKHDPKGKLPNPTPFKDSEKSTISNSDNSLRLNSEPNSLKGVDAQVSDTRGLLGKGLDSAKFLLSSSIASSSNPSSILLNSSLEKQSGNSRNVIGQALENPDVLMNFQQIPAKNSTESDISSSFKENGLKSNTANLNESIPLKASRIGSSFRRQFREDNANTLHTSPIIQKHNPVGQDNKLPNIHLEKNVIKQVKPESFINSTKTSSNIQNNNIFKQDSFFGGNIGVHQSNGIQLNRDNNDILTILSPNERLPDSLMINSKVQTPKIGVPAPAANSLIATDPLEFLNSSEYTLGVHGDHQESTLLNRKQIKIDEDQLSEDSWLAHANDVIEEELKLSEAWSQAWSETSKASSIASNGKFKSRM
ncbi:hypothetical protein AYI68_g3832 [Smittium mucronatum]|uniref:Uncharacterized protein n=1 Tax=Smittium mucronatum TaxID=133383 RepID=A0A1R0GYR7_9FUNG|nr:hypothetical protein AYI68_g3832 [Smittium mucronatum]